MVYLFTGYSSTEIQRLQSCSAALFFHKPLKTFLILPALKHHSPNSEMIRSSDSKSFRIIFSALCHKAARKADCQFSARPCSYYSINKKRLYCQQLHTLGSNTRMPDTISKIKIPFPTKKRKENQNHHHKHITPSFLPLLSPTKYMFGNSSLSEAIVELEGVTQSWKERAEHGCTCTSCTNL